MRSATGTVADSATGTPRALVVRIGALGDVLLTRRLTYSLWQRGFRSTLLAPLRHAFLLRKDPWVEDILDSESSRFAAAFAGEWPFTAPRFDLALVISESAELMKSATLAAGQALQIPPRPVREDASIALQWAEAARSLCEPFTGAVPALSTEGAAIRPGATLIHPGSGARAKNWPLEHFAELSRRLEQAGHEVAWIRGPAEANLSREAHRGSWIEQPGLRDLAATLAAARLCIGNDSGVSHLAGAVGAQTLALFGPTNPEVWRPDGPQVRFARAASGALEDLSVKAVLHLVDREPGAP